MSITLKDIINLKVFKEAKILTNLKDQLDYPVDAISVMEYPVENFVRTNEIVLSTCMSCEDEEIFNKFILDMANLDATALVIALGCYVDEIPDNIIQIAEENSLAVITIPWELRFSEIVESVFTLLAKEKNLEVEKYRLVKDILITKFLEKLSLERALQYIEKNLNIPCALLDSNKIEIAKSKDFKKSVTGLKDLDSDVFLYKIEHSNILFAYLLFDTKDKNINSKNKSSYDQMVHHNIVNPLLLWFERNQTIYEMEIHHKEKFILNLIDDKDIDYEKMISLGKSYGFNLEKPYIALVGKLDSLEKIENEENIKLLKDLAIRLAKSENKECLVAFRNTFLIIFLENKDESIEEYKSFIKKFDLSIQNLYPGVEFVWGIGGVHENTNSIYYSYMDAIMSLKNGILYSGDHINTMSATLEYKIYAELIKNKNIMDIVEKVLKDVEESGSKDLMNTLYEYYANNRNISKTAEKIFLHRQSLNYRLKKAESITGLSLDNPKESFLLELCVKLYHYNKLSQL